MVLMCFEGKIMLPETMKSSPMNSLQDLSLLVLARLLQELLHRCLVAEETDLDAQHVPFDGLHVTRTHRSWLIAGRSLSEVLRTICFVRNLNRLLDAAIPKAVEFQAHLVGETLL
jgi:hypothetical protein